MCIIIYIYINYSIYVYNYQSEGWNGCNGSPWMRYGYGVERASLHFQGRASLSDLIGSGMYKEVWDCRKADLEARHSMC